MFERPQQPDGLVSVLKNKSAEYGDRDDAAMDLGSYDGPEVESALLNVLLDETEDEGLVETAAESLSEVWTRKNFESEALVHTSASEGRDLARLCYAYRSRDKGGDKGS